MAAPMAGTWLQPIPAEIRAITSHLPLGWSVVRHGKRRARRPAPTHHHRRVALGGHAGHARRKLNERLAVRCADLSKEINVSAFSDHGVVIATQNGRFLRFGKIPLAEVSFFISLEPIAVGWDQQRHAELVEMIATAR